MSEHHPLGDHEARRPVTPEDAAQPQGPYAPAIVLGIVGVLVSAAVLLRELAVVEVDLVEWGPWIVVGLGVALLVLGAVGIARRGR